MSHHQQRALWMLREILKTDGEALQEVLDHRVPCSAELLKSEAPGVIGLNRGLCTLGALGLINGVLGQGFEVAAVYDERGVLIDFRPAPEGSVIP